MKVNKNRCKRHAGGTGEIWLLQDVFNKILGALVPLWWPFLTTEAPRHKGAQRFLPMKKYRHVLEYCIGHFRLARFLNFGCVEGDFVGRILIIKKLHFII